MYVIRCTLQWSVIKKYFGFLLMKDHFLNAHSAVYDTADFNIPKILIIFFVLLIRTHVLLLHVINA